MRCCNKNIVSVTPSGARTGLRGGALPLYGGDAIQWTLEKIPSIQLVLDEKHEAHLLIEVDGFDEIKLIEKLEKNLLVNIIKGNLSDEQCNDELPIAIREIFELTVKLGGTISGEHGIGLDQKSYMDIPFTAISLRLMKEIKQIFDPNNIMNPGKILE